MVRAERREYECLKKEGLAERNERLNGDKRKKQTEGKTGCVKNNKPR